MKQLNPIKRYFASGFYPHSNALLEHVVKISKEIRAKNSVVDEAARFPVSKHFPSFLQARIALLSEFDRAVLGITPDFFDGKTNNLSGITRELMRRGTELSETELSRRVKNSLVKLKHAKLIEPLGKAVKLREASEAEVKRHSNLVNQVLQGGHTILPGAWRANLTWAQVMELGKKGLASAIETHSIERGDFQEYAAARIAAAIAAEVRARKKDTTTFELAPAAKSELQRNIQTLFRKKAKLHHIGVFALVRLGHTFQDIAKHFGAGDEVVRQMHRIALRLLRYK